MDSPVTVLLKKILISSFQIQVASTTLCCTLYVAPLRKTLQLSSTIFAQMNIVPQLDM